MYQHRAAGPQASSAGLLFRRLMCGLNNDRSNTLVKSSGRTNTLAKSSGRAAFCGRPNAIFQSVGLTVFHEILTSVVDVKLVDDAFVAATEDHHQFSY